MTRLKSAASISTLGHRAVFMLHLPESFSHSAQLMDGWDSSFDRWGCDNGSEWKLDVVDVVEVVAPPLQYFPGFTQQLTIFVSDTFHLCDVQGGSVSCCCQAADSSGAFSSWLYVSCTAVAWATDALPVEFCLL